MIAAAWTIGIIALILAGLAGIFLATSYSVLGKKNKGLDPVGEFFTAILVGPAAYVLAWGFGIVSGVLFFVAAIFGIIGANQ